MILLDGHSLNALQTFRPVSFSPEIQERDGSATMVLGPKHPGLNEGDWLQDDMEPGAGVVWQVKGIQEDELTFVRTIQLEHVIKTLGEKTMFGEIRPQDMGGTASGVSAQAAAQYVLGRQSDWVLDQFGYNFTAPYSFNGENLFDALEIISGSLPDSCWVLNTTVYPFKISIVEKSSAVLCEMREGRNLKTISRNTDRGPMYTRVYPIGYNNKHIPGDFVSKNEGVFGRKDKTITDNSIKDVTLLQRWAEDYLNNHCEPLVTITATGRNVSSYTGLAIDDLKIGVRCQVPIPRRGIVITERITKIRWRDKIADPEDITVTMANNKQDVSRILRQMQTSGGRSSRASAKEAQEDHAWIDDTTEHVRLVAEAFIGQDGQNPVDWSRVAQLGVDQNGISGRVTRTEGGLVTAQSAITANENAITAEVTRATGAESSLSGQISVEAGKISQVVTAVGADGEVTAASICLAINESGDSNATINASKIYLLGQTIANTITANYIATKISSIASLLVQNVTGETIEASTVKIRPVAGMGAVSVATGYNGSSLTRNGNTYTLRLAKFNGDYDEWTFSRAATLSAEWDGSRKFTVSASPQGVSRYTTLMSAIPNANVSWDGTLATIALKATIDDGETTVNVGNVTMDVANFLQDKTGTNKITANGLYSAESGYIGFGDIEIDVPQSTVEPTTLSMQWNGSRKLTANASPQGVSRYTTIVSAIPASDKSLSGTTLTLPLKATYDDGETTVSVGNITVNIASELTAENNAGRAAVTLNDPTWNGASGAVTSRTVTVSTSGRKNASGVTDNLSKSVALFLTQDAWSSNKKTVRMRQGSESGTTYAQVEVDASSLVTSAGYAGRAAVTLNDPSWSGNSSNVTNRTVTVTTAGRTKADGTIENLSKSVALYLTQDSWSSNKKIVRMRVGGTDGTTYAQTEVDASSLVTTALNAGKAAVGISGASWSGNSSNVTSRTVSVNTTGRTNTSGAAANLTTSIGLYLTQSDWSGNSKTVYMREGSQGGNIRAQIAVDATARYDAGVASVYGDYLVPIWGERAGDNYNANLYKTSGGAFVRKIYASGSTGVHVPLSEDGADMNSPNLTEIPSTGITANGNYKFRSGYAGIRYLKVEVSGVHTKVYGKDPDIPGIHHLQLYV